MKRFTIVNMMMLVGVVALGIAAMRSATPTSEKAVFSVTLLVLFVGLLGAIVTRGDAAWVGFALFGWGYAALAFLPALRDEFQPHLFMNALLDDVTSQLFAIPADPGPHPFTGHFPLGAVTKKMVNGVAVPLSQSDLNLQDAYLDRATAYYSRVEALGTQIDLTRRTGHSILALTFGLIGAILGQFLAWRHTSHGLSSGREFSTETSLLTS